MAKKEGVGKKELTGVQERTRWLKSLTVGDTVFVFVPEVKSSSFHSSSGRPAVRTTGKITEVSRSKVTVEYVTTFRLDGREWKNSVTLHKGSKGHGCYVSFDHRNCNHGLIIFAQEADLNDYHEAKKRFEEDQFLKYALKNIPPVGVTPEEIASLSKTMKSLLVP